MATFTVNTAEWGINPDDERLSFAEALQQAHENADMADTIRFAEGLGTIGIDGSVINTSVSGRLLIDGDTTGDGVADIKFTSIGADGFMVGSVFDVSGNGDVEFRNLEFADMALRPVDARLAADADRNLAVIESTGSNVTLTRVTFTNIEVGDLDGTYADNHRGSDGANGRGGISGIDGGTGRDGVNGAPGGWGGTGGDAVQARADAAPIIQSGGELTIQDVAFAGTGRAVGMDGGRGGDGGNGGRGGNAGEGGDGNIITRPGDGGNGGRAGNGGDGGDGGPGGWASNGIILLDGATLAGPRRMAWDADLLDAGRAGEGGRAGTGGSAGTAGSGGQGGDGFLWFSDGANGIGGGTGAAGSRGAAGPDGQFNTYLLLESGGSGFKRVNTIVYVTEESRSLAEGESITLSVVRAGETGTDLDVPWQLQGALTDDVDGPLSGSLRFFAGGADVQAVTLTFRADTRLDPDADYTFLLGSGGEFGWSGNDSDASVEGLGTFETMIRVTDSTAATEGNDTIDGSAQNDAIDLLGGNDLFRGVTGNDRVHGGDGADTLLGGPGDDSLQGGAGTDRLDGGTGDDTMDGGLGNDRYIIDSAGDVITGEIGFSQGGGIDTVESWISYTLTSNLEILRLQGTDNIDGAGGFAPEAIVGQAGSNLLDGGGGNDVITAKAGDDTLIGGLGADSLVGDAGADVFDFNNINESRPGQADRDFINGFVNGEDKIDLSDIDANINTTENDAFFFIDSVPFHGIAGEMRFFTFGGGNYNIVEADVDGDGSADMQIFVNLTNEMLPGDFIL